MLDLTTIISLLGELTTESLQDCMSLVKMLRADVGGADVEARLMEKLTEILKNTDTKVGTVTSLFLLSLQLYHSCKHCFSEAFVAFFSPCFDVTCIFCKTV